MIGDLLILGEGHGDNARRAQRELGAAVALARNQNDSWTVMADALDTTRADAQARYEDPSTGRHEHAGRIRNKMAFWSKVLKGPRPDDCWLWMGAVPGDGYGRFRAQHEGK